jgi:hypothetical protein
MHATVRTAEQQADFCRAAADAAAAQLRAGHTPYPLGDVPVEARPGYGRGRPRAPKPRRVKARRSRLKTTMRPHTERLGRLEAEAGCFVLRTHVPPAGALAHHPRELLTVEKAQQGTEQNDGFRKAPVIVHRLCLKKPERLEALGVLVWLSLLLWRLRERQRHAHVASTGRPLDGGGQEAHRAPDGLQEADEMRRGAGLHSWPAAPAGAPALRRPTAVSCRPGGVGDLLHAPHRLTADQDGRHTSLAAPETAPPLGGDRGPAHPGVGLRAASRSWWALARAPRGIAARAFAPWKQGAGRSLAARPGGKPPL